MDEPFLSIIVPVYNSEKYLSEFLDSLVSACNSDFEILLIDDGSMDSSAEIASEYASAYPFIRLERQENSGPAAARNRGIEHTSGKFIAFMDSDDIILSVALNTMINAVKCYDAEMWISDFCRVANNGHVLDRVYQIKETAEPILDKGYIDEFLSAPDCVWNVWRCVFGRDFLNRNSLRFIEGVNIAEDLEFMVRALSCADKVAFFHNPYYSYRVNYGETLTRRYDAKRVRDLTGMISCASAGLKRSVPSFSQALQNKLAFEYILNLATCYQIPKADRAEAFRSFADTWEILDAADSSAAKLIKKAVALVGMRPVAGVLYCLKKMKRACRSVSINAAQLMRKENE